MKVRVLYPSAFAGLGLDYSKDVVEVPDEMAPKLIEVGYAEAVDVPKAEPKAEAEEATAPKARKATVRKKV